MQKRRFFLTGYFSHSPDLVPCDFYRFRIIQTSFKGSFLGSLGKVQQCTSNAVKGIAENVIHKCFHMWQKRITSYTAVKGCSLQPDKSN